MRAFCFLKFYDGRKSVIGVHSESHYIICNGYIKNKELQTKLTNIFNKHRNDYQSAKITREAYNPRKSYVYEWFTIEPRKIFYVGKGKNKRYKHILKEIEAFTKGKGRGKFKGILWKALKDNFGIDYHIVLDNLISEDLEVCFIINRLVEGQPLLQHIIPWEDDRLTNEIYNQWLKYNYPPKGTKYIDLIK